MWWRKSRKNSNRAVMHKNPGISHAELWIFLCKKVKIDRKMKKTGMKQSKMNKKQEVKIFICEKCIKVK